MPEGGATVDFATIVAPGTEPKIHSIFDFTNESLEQLAFWLEQRGLHTPVSNLLGFSQFTANVDQVVDNASRTSTQFGDLATGTVGPQVTGLSDGRYAVAWAALASPSGGGSAQMGISVNGDDPTTSTAYYFSNGATYFGVKFTTRTLNGGGNNTIKCVYRNSTGGGTVTAQDRSLLVLRVGNV